MGRRCSPLGSLQLNKIRKQCSTIGLGGTPRPMIIWCCPWCHVVENQIGRIAFSIIAFRYRVLQVEKRTPESSPGGFSAGSWRVLGGFSARSRQNLGKFLARSRRNLTSAGDEVFRWPKDSPKGAKRKPKGAKRRQKGGGQKGGQGEATQHEKQ